MLKYKFAGFILLFFFTTLLSQAQSDDSIKWLTWEEAVAAHEKKPKKIFIDVYTDWCGWCKKMDATTFKDAQVVDLMNSHFYAVKLDAEMKRDVSFKGDTYSFVKNGRRGYHELAAALMNGKMSYPTTVYLTEGFEMIQPIPGYQNSQNMRLILEYIGSDEYNDKSWEEFVASKQSAN